MEKATHDALVLLPGVSCGTNTGFFPYFCWTAIFEPIPRPLHPIFKSYVASTLNTSHVLLLIWCRWWEAYHTVNAFQVRNYSKMRERVINCMAGEQLAYIFYSIYTYDNCWPLSSTVTTGHQVPNVVTCASQRAKPLVFTFLRQPIIYLPPPFLIFLLPSSHWRIKRPKSHD